MQSYVHAKSIDHLSACTTKCEHRDGNVAVIWYCRCNMVMSLYYCKILVKKFKWTVMDISIPSNYHICFEVLECDSLLTLNILWVTHVSVTKRYAHLLSLTPVAPTVFELMACQTNVIFNWAGYKWTTDRLTCSCTAMSGEVRLWCTVA
jgi:hypothetical protein